MTRKEIEELKQRASVARQAHGTVNSSLRPIVSSAVSANLDTVGDFLRNVENVLSAAADVIETRPTG